MAEYINKEAVRDALYETDAILMSGLKILNQFPAADVAPVRHGKWIKRKHWDFHVCSECSFETSPSKYCPNCGADMRGGDKRCLE